MARKGRFAYGNSVDQRFAAIVPSILAGRFVLRFPKRLI